MQHMIYIVSRDEGAKVYRPFMCVCRVRFKTRNDIREHVLFNKTSLKSIIIKGMKKKNCSFSHLIRFDHSMRYVIQHISMVKKKTIG